MNANLQESISFAVHLRAEHRRLHRSVLEAVHESHGSVSVLADRLRQLRDELERHFREEDEGGCLEEAVSRCPAVADQAMWVAWEHPLLLGELDGLIHQLEDRERVSDAWREDFLRLTKKLTAHEEAEDRIMSRALGISA
jgi:hypothetical protein